MPVVGDFKARLFGSIEKSDTKLKKYLDSRMRLLEQYVTPLYGDANTDSRIPVNMIELAVTIYVFNLVQHRPRALVTTNFMAQRATANNLQQALDRLLEETAFDETLRMSALQAMFGPAIVKTGLTFSDGPKEIEGMLFDPGQPFCNVVDVSNAIIDPRATHWLKARFLGDKYSLPLEQVMDSGDFQNTDKLRPEEQADMSKDSPQRLAKPSWISDEDLEPRVRLADIWLPKENVVLTVPSGTNPPHVILREVQWDGPERGPYEFLLFHEVPENVLPLPPVFVLKDLHDSINDMVRKMMRQATRQKTIGVFVSGEDDDARRIKDATDGEVVRATEFGNFMEVNVGGVPPVNTPFLMWETDRFNRMAGNLDLLGGLAVQSDTVGQESIMQGQSSTRFRDMGGRVVKFGGELMRKLAWYLFYDETTYAPLIKRVPGTNIEVQTIFTSDDIEGDFLDYDFDILPYSMEDPTPAVRLNKIQQLLQQVVFPMLQMGASADAIWPVVRLCGKYMHIAEADLNDIMVSVGAMPAPEERVNVAASHERTMPTSTTRTEIRRTVPGGQPGMDNVMMQTALAASQTGQPQGAPAQ